MATKIGMPKEQREAEGARLKVFWERYQSRMKGMGEEITQDVFAQKHFGMSQGNFGHLIHGRQPIPLEMLFDLAILLEFDPREIRPEMQAFIDKVFTAVRGSEDSLLLEYLSRLNQDQTKEVLNFARFVAADKQPFLPPQPISPVDQ